GARNDDPALGGPHLQEPGGDRMDDGLPALALFKLHFETGDASGEPAHLRSPSASSSSSRAARRASSSSSSSRIAVAQSCDTLLAALLGIWPARTASAVFSSNVRIDARSPKFASGRSGGSALCWDLRPPRRLASARLCTTIGSSSCWKQYSELDIRC